MDATGGKQTITSTLHTCYEAEDAIEQEDFEQNGYRESHRAGYTQQEHDCGQVCRCEGERGNETIPIL
jgi:hypothetical protein